ncbi:delta-9 acyl-CoA desaturase [Niveomyces insectorum RCEF 264]|uniref:Delta 8-(E)-sphingolipid desaturase n=1 Tax=Niveomyces insectorum RCEF 264 TaxID=1081102 RepID=A0A167N9I9_9HYPO|nr:delta-9 acyl-CoA desaturase [Niveomyces insectorum RCEF 264]
MATDAATTMDRDKILDPEAVADLIAQGHTIVIYQDCVLRLDSWLDRHPGGRLAIMHMVGRDATDEIEVYHFPATLKTMKAFRIGRKPPGPWLAYTPPPIRGGVYLRMEITPPQDCRENTDDESLCGDDGTISCGDSTAEASSDSEDSIFAESVLESSTISDVSSECSSLQPPRPPSSSSLSSGPADGKDKTEVSPFSTETQAPPFLSAQGVHAVNRRLRVLPVQETSIAVRPPVTPMDDRNFSTVADFTNRSVQHEIDRDTLVYPPVDPARQEAIVQRYRALHQRVHDEGFYECPYGEYAKEMARYSTLFVLFLATLHAGWYVVSAVFLGLFWHQIMFTAHDAGHRAITHNFVADSLIGLFVADFCCGLSIGWWKSSHNVHHLVTNQAEHDPDIQNVPLFATSPLFFNSLRSTYYDFTFVWDAVADFMVPYQRYTYYPVMGIARFNLYLLSWLHVLSAKSSALGRSTAWWIRPTEIAFMLCYWFLFGYCLLWRALPTWTARVVFVLVSHVVTMPLHVQITLSHWGMSTSDLGESESFPQRQLRTTMDVDCPAWLDFIHGGLQFQAVHHLFPRVPRHNLRRVQVLVREFCDDTGIPYTTLSFVDGNRKVLGRLQEMGDQVNMIIQCQKHMAATGESGLH